MFVEQGEQFWTKLGQKPPEKSVPAGSAGAKPLISWKTHFWR